MPASAALERGAHRLAHFRIADGRVFRVAIYADSCDCAKPERLEYLNDVYRLYRCRGIRNCTEVCPMGLNPWQAIERIREEQLKESL